jgi:hypothetical protein
MMQRSYLQEADMLETLLERYHSEEHIMQGARTNGGTRTLGYYRYFNIHRVLKGLEVCLPPAPAPVKLL